MSNYRVLIGLAVLCAALAVAGASLASTTRRDLPARLGFILFCKTSLAEVTARLGPGRVVPTWDQGAWIERGWYHPTERVYFLVTRRGDAWHRERGLKGAPPVIIATLAAAGHLPDQKLNAGDLGRPGLSLTSLRGPREIKLGDSREVRIHFAPVSL